MHVFNDHIELDEWICRLHIPRDQNDQTRKGDGSVSHLRFAAALGVNKALGGPPVFMCRRMKYFDWTTGKYLQMSLQLTLVPDPVREIYHTVAKNGLIVENANHPE